MPFIPHTEEDISRMLNVIGASSLDALFDEIPESLRSHGLTEVPEGLSEMQVTRLMRERAAQETPLINFIGAGAYSHHIPAAVWEITTRGEFYSAYTPYQAEASQGTLQLLYEYQSMICGLTGMDVSNASVYDGASAVAESILMAVRANRKSKSRKILIPGGLHPHYRAVTETITCHQDIELVEIPVDEKTGAVPVAALAEFAGQDITAVVIQQPNFYGVLEDVDAITDWAHAQGALLIAAVNPMSLAVLREPGAWGEAGADITCGDGQPFGCPLSSGGPYFGFMACRQPLVRQMPGRICGRTVDIEGKQGFTLTLQAREQHIRRSKATSNICTNQGLLVTAATIYLSMLGDEGLRRVASSCSQNLSTLLDAVSKIPGVHLAFSGDHFHEVVLKLTKPAAEVVAAMSARGIAAGLDLGRYDPAMADSLLLCTTEVHTADDLACYAENLAEVLA